MRLETFFEKFELLAEAPNAISKLRALLLDLAVRGRLVPQDPAEGNATELVAAVRGRTTSGRRADEASPAWISADEVPESWEMATLGEVSEIVRGVSFPGDAKSKVAGDGLVACLRTASVQVEIDWEDLIYVPEDVVARDDQWVRPLDIMISMANSYDLVGKVALVREVPERSTFGAFLAAIRPVLIEPRFLLCVLRCSGMQEAFRAGSSQTTNIANISLGRMRPLAFPLPPLAEQKRIVAKVDELMALCDRLEAQQQERQTRHAALARASLARFADAPTPANIELLFHNAYNIEPSDLRKCLLTLAVQGKLAPQDPGDESAVESLSRLDLQSSLVEAEDSEEETALFPSSWVRVRFEDVALVAGGVTLGRNLAGRKTVRLPYLRVANVKRGEIDLGLVKEVAIAEEEIGRYSLRSNDLLMTEGGDWDKVGRAAVWSGEINVCLHQNHVFRARMRSDEISSHWFERYFNSPLGRSYFESAAKQTTNLASINMRQVRGCPVPFPPLAEQRRIVERLTQMMAMVDQLETAIAASQAAASTLMQTVVRELADQA